MLENFTWYQQSGFRFKGERLVLYIDPWNLKGDLPPADLVLLTHAHGDHYSSDDLKRIKGPKTQLSYPSSVFIDNKNDEMWVANFGNHRATVYKRGVSGDTPPIRVIRSGPEEMPAPSLANQTSSSRAPATSTSTTSLVGCIRE